MDDLKSHGRASCATGTFVAARRRTTGRPDYRARRCAALHGRTDNGWLLVAIIGDGGDLGPSITGLSLCSIARRRCRRDARPATVWRCPAPSARDATGTSVVMPRSSNDMASARDAGGMWPTSLIPRRRQHLAKRDEARHLGSSTLRTRGPLARRRRSSSVGSALTPPRRRRFQAADGRATAMEGGNATAQGSPSSKRRSRWQAAAAAAAATLGSWRWRAAAELTSHHQPTPPRRARQPTSRALRVPTTDNTALVPPREARNRWRWATSANGLLWRLQKLTWTQTAGPVVGLQHDGALPGLLRGPGISVIFLSRAYWVFYGQRRWLSARHQPSDDEVHVVWNSGNQVRNTASIDGRALSLSAEEVFESIRTLHVQTALQENQFSGQRLGWFDVTGIERTVALEIIGRSSAGPTDC